jgi:schlafen family protein
MIPKRLEDTTEADLIGLITAGVREGRSVDYKLAMPGGADSDKKEFLADVSSFANTSGGDLVFGMEEDAGVPVALKGVSLVDADAEVQRLDSIMRDGIEPRLTHHIKTVPLANGSTALLIRIDRSWVGPHRVVFKGWDKFYARNSAGKYSLDVNELRAAFTGGLNVAEKIRAFRFERVSGLLQNQAPVPVLSGPKLILHCIPFQSFAGPTTFEIFSFASNPFLIPMLRTDAYRSAINLDGLVVHSGGDSVSAYSQLFRNGSFEAVNGRLLQPIEGQEIIPYVAIEQALMDTTRTALNIMKKLIVEPPVAIAVSFTGVRGYRMASGVFAEIGGGSIREENLILPEIVVQEMSPPITKAMKPIFDMLWNACGLVGSVDFDAEGNWINSRYPYS